MNSVNLSLDATKDITLHSVIYWVKQLTLVDLAEDDYTRKFGLGIVGHRWVPGKHAWKHQRLEDLEVHFLLHTHVSAILGGYILVRFFDQHLDD